MTTAALLESSIPTPGSAALQSRLWGARARDWAEIQEPMVAPLYNSALKYLEPPDGKRLLDVGCGSGVFCALATAAGHEVSGCDATPALLAIARTRLPTVNFLEADLEQLPFPNQAFDAVTGFNSFQYAATPLNALREAHRVLKRGGLLIMATWGRPENCEAAPYLRALAALLPQPAAGAPGQFDLSADGAMRQLATQAGFKTQAELETLTVWDYPDEATALRGLLSAGPAIRAINHAGGEAVTDAVRRVLAGFQQPSGRFQMRNTFRYVLARK